MTAAATDGSTDDSTSAIVAVLTRPAMRSPATAARIAEIDVQDDEDLPDARAGKPRGDRVVADGEQEPPVAGPPEPER